MSNNEQKVSQNFSLRVYYEDTDVGGIELPSLFVALSLFKTAIVIDSFTKVFIPGSALAVTPAKLVVEKTRLTNKSVDRQMVALFQAICVNMKF